MRIVTYNLRCDVKSDGVNSFSSRKGLVLDKIDAEMPDVIGFQEVTPPMNQFLHKKLSGYMLVGCGRGADYGDEHNPVAFRPDRYELIGLDITWLSETPYAPGTRYKIQSVCPRIITHVILRPLGLTAQPFHVYNTHLDHESSEARQQGAKRLLEKMAEDQKTHPFPALVTGDFNALPDAPEIRMIKEKLSDLTENAGVTFHNFGRTQYGQIDYIFAGGFDGKAPAVKWMDELNGVFLSDHYPVECDVKRKDGREV